MLASIQNLLRLVLMVGQTRQPTSASKFFVESAFGVLVRSSTSIKNRHTQLTCKKPTRSLAAFLHTLLAQ